MKRQSSIDRFMEQVTDFGSCWIWTAFVNNKGYGMFFADGKPIQAHRFSYKYFCGELVTGMEIDHLCHNRSCVNPDHLEQVTHTENVRRSSKHKTHCIRGHEFTLENTYTDPRGFRQCRTCEKSRRTTETYRANRRVNAQAQANH